jgi:16S rRNA (cytosine967-C5)-methyltransferase
MTGPRAAVGKHEKATSGLLPAGYLARAMASDLIAGVMRDGRTLEDALSGAYKLPLYRDLSATDRGLARLIAATVLRRHGQLEAILASYIERPLPPNRGQLMPILLAAAAQLVFLQIAPHAVINLAVEQTRRDPRARRFDRLANAVLRRVSEHGASIAARQDAARLNVPEWLLTRWTAAYGEGAARKIAEASLKEAALDITVKGESEKWARQLNGILLPTGTVRIAQEGRVEDLPGYREGAWWVQDAAAALPARLLRPEKGQRIADLCAAPGGKTAQIAAAGASVTAVDSSAQRLERLRANLARLKLPAEVVEADAADWRPGILFDSILLDAPCLSTGTIRRHPDILHLKRPGDLERLCELQARLLDNAAHLVKPGGFLVYCTCSLEPEEGPRQVERLLAGQPFERVPISATEFGGPSDWVTPEGDLRTFPFHMPMAHDKLSGMDGFFAARLKRRPA